MPQNTCAKKSKPKTICPEVCKKGTLAQMFSCEFCEISENNFFTEHLPATASQQIEQVGAFTRKKESKRCLVDGKFASSRA